MLGGRELPIVRRGTPTLAPTCGYTVSVCSAVAVHVVVCAARPGIGNGAEESKGWRAVQDECWDYTDLSATAFSSDPGVHNDRTGSRYVTEEERMQRRYEVALARLRAQEAELGRVYGPNILDEWDDLCRDHAERGRELRDEHR